MELRADEALLDSFAQSFAKLDDLWCTHQEPPPGLLMDGFDSDDWNIIRWNPTKLDAPRNGIESLRRVGRLPTLFELFAVSYAWLDVDLLYLLLSIQGLGLCCK